MMVIFDSNMANVNGCPASMYNSINDPNNCSDVYLIKVR